MKFTKRNLQATLSVEHLTELTYIYIFSVFDILDTTSRLTLRNTAPSQNCKFGIEKGTRLINLQFLK